MDRLCGFRSGDYPRVGFCVDDGSAGNMTSDGPCYQHGIPTHNHQMGTTAGALREAIYFSDRIYSCQSSIYELRML